MIKSKLTGNKIIDPKYKSATGRSITSLSKVSDHPAIVYFEKEIGHIQTKELENVETYYDEEYEFYNQSEEDDILYTVIGGKKIYRQQHQVETILSKLEFVNEMKILDYGCAKGTVMKRLLAKNPHIKPHLFDISKMYEHLWNNFVTPEQYSSYQTKPEWIGQMDVVTSFFAFEHVLEPIKELNEIKTLLKDNGLVYIIVPNVFENIADFIVNDHVHHFSETSIQYLFSKTGFELIEIDSKSHFGAYIAIGKKTNSDSLPFRANAETLNKIEESCEKIASYWNGLQDKIQLFENENSNKKCAIYGAGVYGNFIATNLTKMDNLTCFIDQNELLYNEEIAGVPVYSPLELPEDVSIVYVGVNPKIAKGIIDSIESWKNKEIQFLYI